MRNIDIRNAVAAFTLSAIALSLFGCSHTISGAKEDVSTAGEKAATAVHSVGTAVHNAGTAVKEIPQNIGSAAVVTPEVKTEILRDPVLDNSQNQINVNSHDRVVHLTGHVQTADMRQRAAEDAQVILTKRHPDYQLSNELTVSAGN
jgi:osmotically-inducible protein OsmY